MSGKKFEMKLTGEQQKLLKEAFGEAVSSLKLSIEDFGTNEGKGDVTLRVLKIDNVATVLRSQNALRDVVN